jgi:hypothetical protein
MVFAAGSALVRASVLGQVVIEAGIRGKRAVADRAIDTVEFVIVAEHKGWDVIFCCFAELP